MDRICQYSTIIFAGNVSVLLIVAISTDYWEYRGFHTDRLIPTLRKLHNRLRLVFPSDTSSYFVVQYFWDPPPVKTSIFATTPVPKKEVVLRNHTRMYYQPPAVLVKRWEEYVEYTDGVRYDAERNVTVAVTSRPTIKSRPIEDKLVLYIQYSNLFRECDILEAGVRARLGLTSRRRHRCFNFISNNRIQQEGDFIGSELPAVMHLERIGFTMSLVCIVVSLISLVSGAYGLITHNRSYILTASSAACASGIAMTVCIAIFHGKGHLIHRHEFLAGVELPFKKTVEEHRQYYYGWSFGLAWICVILCFIHTWVWLVKAQDMPDLCFPSRSRWGFFRRRQRRRRKKQPSGPGRRPRRVGDNSHTRPRMVVGAGLTSVASPLTSGGVTTTNLDENQYSVIPDSDGIGLFGNSTPAAAAAAEHCPPCGRSLARTANGDARVASGLAASAADVANVPNHVGNQCRGLSKSAGNFLFLGGSITRGMDPEEEEYRILNRPPDEFKVLLRPSETLKAFSADTLSFP